MKNASYFKKLKADIAETVLRKEYWQDIKNLFLYSCCPADQILSLKKG